MHRRPPLYHFTRALDAARQLSLTPPASLYRARGLAYETLGEFERARADHETALQLAHEASDRHGEWQALLDLGLLWAGRAYAQTGDYYQQALALARTMDDPATAGPQPQPPGQLVPECRTAAGSAALPSGGAGYVSSTLRSARQGCRRWTCWGWRVY